MNMNELIQTTPIAVEKSTRTEEVRAITSCQAGKIVPLLFIPLLREDSVVRGELRMSFDMAETLYPLLNAVNVKVMAHYLSPIAFNPLFTGLDSLNRSYQGIVEPGTSTVIPYYSQYPFQKSGAIWKSLGVQWKEGANINYSPVEAYNALVNWRRRARTDKLPERALGDLTLAEAFWKNTIVNDIVPDWDQSAMDGEVELQFATTKLRIGGIGSIAGGPPIAPATNVAVSDYGSANANWAEVYPYGTPVTTPNYRFLTGPAGVPQVFAQLQDAGVKLSLANIELAKQTAAFAKLRERFDGIDDDHIIDLLMEGIRVPDEALKHPILLDSRSTIFGMNERKAMDGEHLDVSLTTGRTEVALRFRTPPLNTGGVILVTCEIVPEQLYERQYDTFLGTSNPGSLPNFMRDYLDPEKVEVVPNQFVDVHHSTPTGTFGYAPLNHGWNRNITHAGGKFYRPNPDTFVEDRLRFWSADQINPTLADDFYMVSDLPNSVFADTLSDPFEVVTLGRVAIVGNTVFGDRLAEDTNSYDEIMDEVDTSRIAQVAVPPATVVSEDGE